MHMNNIGVLSISDAAHGSATIPLVGGADNNGGQNETMIHTDITQPMFAYGVGEMCENGDNGEQCEVKSEDSSSYDGALHEQDEIQARITKGKANSEAEVLGGINDRTGE